MAGFRIGRGRDPQRDPRSAQQGPHGRQGPYPGQQPPRQPYGQQPRHGGQPQWQQPSQQGEPEYFDGQHGYGGGGNGGGPSGYGNGGGPSGYGNGGGGGYGGGPSYGAPGGEPGQTQQFSVGEAPGYDPYGEGDDYRDDGYRTGQPPAPPAGPRLPWKALLSGIVLRPADTFWQMRDYAMWVPALIVTFIYGLLAVFGFDKAREDVLNAPMSQSVPWILSTGVAVVISGLILGAVTHTLARQLGGDGTWAPTIGLSMLIMSITDAPRLVFAMFLGGDSTFVQVLGWATWLMAGALFTSMVSKSHDLPWPKALGASAIQLLALLSLIKLGML
ncbi:YIP1 family protein [Streptomyces sp. LX-29]|uniref:Yip1 family protein n=1 Tax=Streptomyces sp. LX-29 TaxID=2900152 RepID=UPI00240D3443|nr:Yip1 family protein [Streptomyces sp. LX-29]WFB08626.1 YIP1 family protein [Streptomyces sp. LX-29]